MSNLFKLLFGVFLCIIALNYAECIGRNSFEMKLTSCRMGCNLRNPLRKNKLQTCLVLLDHNNVTVTRCVADCLKQKNENLGQTVECQCRLERCIPNVTLPPSTTSESTTTSKTDSPSSAASTANSTPNTSSGTVSPSSAASTANSTPNTSSGTVSPSSAASTADSTPNTSSATASVSSSTSTEPPEAISATSTTPESQP